MTYNSIHYLVAVLCLLPFAFWGAPMHAQDEAIPKPIPKVRPKPASKTADTPVKPSATNSTAPPGSAKNQGPSMVDTAAYIKAAMESSTMVDLRKFVDDPQPSSNRYAYKNVVLSNCVLSLDRLKLLPNHTNTQHYEFALNQAIVSTSEPKSEAEDLSLKNSGKLDVAQSRWFYTFTLLFQKPQKLTVLGNDGKSTQGSTISFSFYAEDLQKATSLQHAINHAIVLCGGESMTF